MIYAVIISRTAEKQLRKVPLHIAEKLRIWVEGVEEEGLENMRKIPGFHDEALKGKRKGQRSIRLSRAYRAVYEISTDDSIEFVSIEEVSRHEY